MTKKTWLVSTVSLVVFAAPAVSADDDLGAYNEDLSSYGQPRPTSHHWRATRQYQATPTVVDAQTVRALRRAHSDDGLGSYNEDASQYGTSVGVVPTFVVAD